MNVQTFVSKCKVKLSIGHFTVVYLDATPLFWSETEVDHVVIEI